MVESGDQRENSPARPRPKPAVARRENGWHGCHLPCHCSSFQGLASPTSSTDMYTVERSKPGREAEGLGRPRAQDMKALDLPSARDGCVTRVVSPPAGTRPPALARASLRGGAGPTGCRVTRRACWTARAAQREPSGECHGRLTAWPRLAAAHRTHCVECTRGCACRRAWRVVPAAPLGISGHGCHQSPRGRPGPRGGHSRSRQVQGRDARIQWGNGLLRKTARTGPEGAGPVS